MSKILICPLFYVGANMVSISRKDLRMRVSDDRVLRRVFEGNGDQTILHNERPRDYYSYPNNIQVIRSKKMRRTGHTTLRRKNWVHNT
jgi:hypothetical protein